MVKHGPARLLLIILLFTARASAQDNQDEPIRLKSDLVMLTASVLDRGGKVVKSLKAEDFVVYEDGRKQKIEHFASTEDPFTLMLLLDVSGSTRDDIELIKRAARNFLAELRADDRVGVIMFSGDVELIADFKDSRKRVEAAIDALRPTRGDDGFQYGERTGTSFYDAFFLAVEESPMKEVEGRKAIVCMSDGVDSTSRMKYKDIARLVEKSEASVYLLELNTEEVTLAGLLREQSDPGYINFSQSQVNRYYDEFEPDSFERHKPRKLIPVETRKKINRGLYEIARREIREMAERTGGRPYAVRSLQDLTSVYKQIADDLRSQYSIGYYPSNEAHDGRWRKIRVDVPRGAAVRTRPGYWAPTK